MIHSIVRWGCQKEEEEEEEEEVVVEISQLEFSQLKLLTKRSRDSSPIEEEVLNNKILLLLLLLLTCV
jgi:hypothetical protein